MPNDAERGQTGGKPFQKEKASMEAIFDTLQKTASRLNTTADSANDLIRTTNERLGAMGAGVEFDSGISLRVRNLSQYDERNDAQVDAGFDDWVLCYAKIHGTWQLGVHVQHNKPGSSGIEGDYVLLGSDDDEPLLNADRELRIEAASNLPDFLKAYTAHLARLAEKLSRSEE